MPSTVARANSDSESSGMPVSSNGVDSEIGPIALSTPYEDTEIPLDSLSEFARSTVEQTISASSLSNARQIVGTISDTAELNR